MLFDRAMSASGAEGGRRKRPELGVDVFFTLLYLGSQTPPYLQIKSKIHFERIGNKRKTGRGRRAIQKRDYKQLPASSRSVWFAAKSAAQVSRESQRCTGKETSDDPSHLVESVHHVIVRLSGTYHDFNR